jgi:sulfur carrier protein ThiS
MAGELGRVGRVERGRRGARVELDGKAVDVDATYADALEDLGRRGRLVLVHEGRPLLPAVGRVDRVVEDPDGGLSFLLERSHAVHRLAPDSAEFAGAARLLRESAAGGPPVAVSVDDRLGVVDVRPVPPDLLPRPGPPPFPDKRPRYRLWPWQWPVPVLSWLRAMSPSRAQQLFDAMSACSCAPTTTPAPCIPFLYPDDGCFARAEEMVRLLAAQGVTARKVWSKGWLVAPTRNHPSCSVTWGWHVAPTVRVRGTFPSVVTRVIDPSLFTAVATPDQWAAAQPVSEPLQHTDATPYFPTWTSWGPVTDADHQGYLEQYRDALRFRSLGPDGPPPYANCS